MSEQGTYDGPGGLDGLLSSRSVCGLLDTSDRNLRRLVASGEFPPPDRRLGRGLRWKCSTVQVFLNENGSCSEKGSTAASDLAGKAKRGP